MAHHEDVLDLQGGDREFQRRAGAVVLSVRRVGRHEVGDVAVHEQFPVRCPNTEVTATRLSQQAIDHGLADAVLRWRACLNQSLCLGKLDCFQ
jgi:hypothetical protein